MASVKLSKSSLTQQRQQLVLYKRALPSLDLKRRQLAVELDKARKELAAMREGLAAADREAGARMPMLACPELRLDGLLRLDGVEVDEENMVGTKLPRFVSASFTVAPYPLLGTPAWFDLLIESLRKGAEQRLRLLVQERRVAVLTHALRRITQRVNLFEHVLIPQANENIKRIRIYLGDVERDAVVRSKLAKARMQVVGA